MQVADIALPYLTKPEDHGTDAADVQGGDGGSDGGDDDEDEEASGTDDDADDITAASAPDLSPSSEYGMAGQQQEDSSAALPCHRQQLAQLRGSDVQVVSSGCWTSMKEVGLMVGSLAQRLPMPGEGCFWMDGLLCGITGVTPRSFASLRAVTYETGSEGAIHLSRSSNPHLIEKSEDTGMCQALQGVQEHTRSSMSGQCQANAGRRDGLQSSWFLLVSSGSKQSVKSMTLCGPTLLLSGFLESVCVRDAQHNICRI